MVFRPKKRRVGTDQSNYRADLGKKGRHCNKKIEIDGVKFDSKFEYEIYRLFKLHPLVESVIPHPPAIELLPVTYYNDPQTGKRTMLSREVRYHPDLQVTFTNGKVVLIDAKTIQTLEDKFIIKIKLMEYYLNTRVFIFYPAHQRNYQKAIQQLHDGTFINCLSKNKLAKLGYH